MAPLKSYLTLLYESAKLHPSLPAFKVPEDDPSSEAWRTVSYSELTSILETFARYWAHELLSKNVPKRSVVAVWLKGTTFADFLTLWGVARAGYVPQPISLRMTSPIVIRQMMVSGGAKALIHDPSVENSVASLSGTENNGDGPSFVPCLPISDVNPQRVTKLPLPDLWMPSADDDILLLYSTSGSSGGIPKPVPVTARWFGSMIQKELERAPKNKSPGQRPCVNLIGSWAHSGSLHSLTGAIYDHGSVIIPHQLPFPTAELQRMIKDAHLQNILMFSSFLEQALIQARRDPALLESLRCLRGISYGGLAVDREVEVWAVRTGGLRLTNMFASTEMGYGLSSDVDPDSEFTIFKKLSESSLFEFTPIDGEAGGGTNKDRLLELTILPKSFDCPHSSLLDPVTGKFHTGDLFVECAPGQYISKGRNDDWIKMERSLRCDTGAIEATALDVCQDLISGVVVCGVARPCPIMLVEPLDAEREKEAKDSSLLSPSLRREILQRILPFHERRYDHERITDERLIVVVPKGSLPRTATKGNVQRKVTESKFAEEISRAYEEYKEVVF